jgi:hypothetical protein
MRRYIVEQNSEVSLSKEQKELLHERISKIEEGNVEYFNARKEAEKIKLKLKNSIDLG